MSDGIALTLIALVCAGLIALALVWPQGQGARSPAPFGHALAPIVVNAPPPPNPAPLRGPASADATARHH